MSRTFSVTQLNKYISVMLEDELFINNIDLTGEISSLSYSGNTTYFDLTDNSSSIQCVYFDSRVRTLEGGTDAGFRVGDSVIASGTPSLYIKGGKLSFRVTGLKLNGEGDKHRALMLLKEKLRAEGLFERRRPRPLSVKKIAVITSPDGAVIHDIINITKRRNPGVSIALYPCKVQGITAGAEIAQAIKDISQLKDIDAVIIARGGGSDGDLSCFNAETVVRAVYDCGYYIISAVGHETDYTLCDYAADMRAPTPSAAAELLVDCISEDYNKLYNLSAAAEQAFDGLFYRKLKHLKNAAYIINASINYRIQSMNNNILIYNERLRAACRKLLDDKEKAVKTAETVINNLNPMKLISNGYARITRNSAIISGVQDLNIKDNIKIYMSDGTVDAEIVSKKENV